MIKDIITEYLVKYFGVQFEDIIKKRMDTSAIYPIYENSDIDTLMKTLSNDLSERDDDYDPEYIDYSYQVKFDEIRSQIKTMQKGKGFNINKQAGVLYGTAFTFACAKGMDWKLFNPIFISMHPNALKDIEDTLIHEYVHVVTTFLNDCCEVETALLNGTTYKNSDAYEHAIEEITSQILKMMQDDNVSLPLQELKGIQL